MQTLLMFTPDRIVGEPGPFDDDFLVEAHDDEFVYTISVPADAASTVAGCLLDGIKVALIVPEDAVLFKGDRFAAPEPEVADYAAACAGTDWSKQAGEVIAYPTSYGRRSYDQR